LFGYPASLRWNPALSAAEVTQSIVPIGSARPQVGLTVVDGDMQTVFKRFEVELVTADRRSRQGTG